jgi:hypothetical protein
MDLFEGVVERSLKMNRVVVMMTMKELTSY